jgi:hypothetical protein
VTGGWWYSIEAFDLRRLETRAYDMSVSLGRFLLAFLQPYSA